MNFPFDTYTLPEEISQRFTTLAENIGRTHRALGLVMDDYVSDLPHGYHMLAYEAFADLYRQITGESISVVTVRAWRRAAVEYSKHDLTRFESLTDAQLIECIKLSEINNIEPEQIAQWAITNVISTVPAMRAHWLPQTSDGDQTDEPIVTGVLRFISKNIPANSPYRADFDRIIAELRALIHKVRNG